MRFLSSKFTQNALAAGAKPRTDPTAGAAKALPQTPCRFQGAASQKGIEGKGIGRERGRRERGKGVLEKGKREGREGKRGGRERGRRMERDGRGSLRHWR